MFADHLRAILRVINPNVFIKRNIILRKIHQKPYLFNKINNKTCG